MTLVEVGAGVTRRRYEVGSDGVRAVALVAAGRVVPIEDGGMRLVVDGTEVGVEDLRLVGSPEVASDGTRLAWRLAGHGVEADMAVDAPAQAAVVRTRVSLAGAGRLQRVEAERWAPEATASVGLGQPVFGPGWFAGLEHPGAEGFALAVDVDLGARGANRWTAPPLVVGGAPAGQELSAFWDELDRLRACPPRMVVLANNWYQLGAVGRMDEASVVAELDGFGGVATRHGLALDWYCLDDPWDGSWAGETGIWGRLDPARFPRELDRLQRAAAAAGVGGIGLWVSPWGGYFERHEARVTWGRDRGFEIDERGGRWPCLCPAGDTYHRHLAQSLARHTAAGVGYWKIDGVQFDCQESRHGHAVGPAGRTEQMDRFAALLDGVRVVRPDVFVAFTTGSNPSPWWLRHADVVWRGGLDDDAPQTCEGGRLDRFTTYIDTCLDAFKPTGLPVSSVVTFSVVENQARAYRGGGESDAWERHCWFLAGRGSLHHDLYVAPDSLSDGEWATLSRALAWARRNRRVLARSRMIGGRPQAGEPYGFVSVNEGEAIVCLRNPSGRGQPVWPDASDVAGGHLVDLETVWGCRSTPTSSLPTELGPFEVVLFSGRWRPGTREGPPG